MKIKKKTTPEKGTFAAWWARNKNRNKEREKKEWVMDRDEG